MTFQPQKVKGCKSEGETFIAVSFSTQFQHEEPAPQLSAVGGSLWDAFLLSLGSLGHSCGLTLEELEACDLTVTKHCTFWGEILPSSVQCRPVGALLAPVEMLLPVVFVQKPHPVHVGKWAGFHSAVEAAASCQFGRFWNNPLHLLPLLGCCRSLRAITTGQEQEGFLQKLPGHCFSTFENLKEWTGI